MIIRKMTKCEFEDLKYEVFTNTRKNKLFMSKSLIFIITGH